MVGLFVASTLPTFTTIAPVVDVGAFIVISVAFAVFTVAATPLNVTVFSRKNCTEIGCCYRATLLPCLCEIDTFQCGRRRYGRWVGG